jgi:transcriptional regulator with XRE-family HTH domain
MLSHTLQARVARAAQIARSHGITQAQIADALGASQPQVSRILKGECVKASRLLEEVCLYAERFESGVTPEMVRANEELTSALAAVWNGSADHAKALASVIRSLALLGKPSPKK